MEKTFSEVMFEFDLSLKELSRKTGIKYNTIRQYATGYRQPYGFEAEKLQTELNKIGRALSEVKVVSTKAAA